MDTDIQVQPIPIEKIIDLHSKGLSQRQMAELLGISQQAISKRLANLDLDTLDLYDKHKDKVWTIVERMGLQAVVDGTSKNTLRDITASAVAFDKVRLHRGMSTEIVEQRVLKVDLDRAYAAMRQAVVEGTGPAQDVVEVQAPEGGGGGVE